MINETSHINEVKILNLINKNKKQNQFNICIYLVVINHILR